VPGGVGLEAAGLSGAAEISRDGLNQVGYIAFARFNGSGQAIAILERIFATLADSERMIIDLRESRGGDAEMVKALSNYFFDQPMHLVTSIGPKQANGKRPTFERVTSPNSQSERFAGKPLDILISGKTFSAAESFAFGMKVTGRARLIGEATGGGGHMNDFFPLPAGFGASISVGRTFDPRSNKGWEGTGVTPDVPVEADHAMSKTLQLITEESGRLAALDTAAPTLGRPGTGRKKFGRPGTASVCNRVSTTIESSGTFRWEPTRRAQSWSCVRLSTI